MSVAEDGEVTERRRVLGEDEGPVRSGRADKKTKAALKKAKAAEKAEQEDASPTPAPTSAPGERRRDRRRVDDRAARE